MGWIVYLHNVHTKAWVRPLAGDKLNKEHTAGEDDLSRKALNDAVGCGVEEDGVQDFDGADELVTLGSAHYSVRAIPQRVFLQLYQQHVAESEATLNSYLLSHYQK